jgi:hypothetical protein
MDERQVRYYALPAQERDKLMAQLHNMGWTYKRIGKHPQVGMSESGVKRSVDRIRDGGLLADLVRTDRHNHRPIAGDTPDVEAIKVPARAQQPPSLRSYRSMGLLRTDQQSRRPRLLRPTPRRPSDRASLSGSGRQHHYLHRP